jgi:hypothetical protein
MEREEAAEPSTVAGIKAGVLVRGRRRRRTGEGGTCAGGGASPSMTGGARLGCDEGVRIGRRINGSTTKKQFFSWKEVKR